MTDIAHMLTAWLLCAVLLGVVLFCVIGLRKRYMQIKDAKADVEASRRTRIDYARTINEILMQIQRLPQTSSGAQEDRDSAHLLKKFCKFVGYPFRIEIDIDVRTDATHVTITLPDGSGLLVPQQMLLAKFVPGALATYLNSEEFRKTGEGHRFRMHGY